MSRPNPTGHPARFSDEVLVLAAEILVARYPSQFGRPYVFDPFAGTGEALGDLSQRLIIADGVGFGVSGVEIEPAYIVAGGLVRHGDALDPTVYMPSPAGGLVVFTSPVYPNGVADHHYPNDASKRYTYLSSLIKLTGDTDYEMSVTNMGRHGYRGTRRDGGSLRRVAYWHLADAAVKIWADKAELVLLNVSDFKHSKGVVEPVVDDWKALLARHGFSDQFDHPVGTHRMLNSPNADRADNEVIVEARRG